MKRPIHRLARKLKTLRLTITQCANWLSIARAKLGVGPTPEMIQFRDGFLLKTMSPLKETWGEVFEPAIADVYGIRGCEPDLIVDVGANIGAFSCFAAHVHPRAIVHAFEPSTTHANLLMANVTLNRLSNVVPHRTPVTRDGREVVFSEHGTGGASGIILPGNGHAIPMQSVSLDCVDYSRKQSAFFKLDCEGAEGEIIEWICANVSDLPPRIDLACEYHHWCPIPSERLLDMLRVHGFQPEPRTLFDETYLFARRA